MQAPEPMDVFVTGSAPLPAFTPASVRQEFWGLLLAHFAVRGLMEAALRADEDPDRHVVPACRARGPPQGAAVRGPFPLGPSASCMRRCWTKFWRSARRAAEADRCPAGSSAR